MRSRIKFLRGNNDSILSSNKVLEAGQPLYNFDTRYLYVGNKEDSETIANKKPITVPTLEGNTKWEAEITSPTYIDFKINNQEKLKLDKDQLLVNTDIKMEDGTKITGLITNAETATNANNSQKIQEIDLSTNSVASFGDYVIAKRKLIWEGSFNVSNSFTTILSEINYLKGKTIELEVVRGSSPNIGAQIIKIKLPELESFTWVPIAIYSNTNDQILAMTQLSVAVDRGDLRLRYYTYYVPNSSGSLLVNIVVRSIYEIIE